MNKILCFGELLLRLPPASGGRWLKDNQMPVFIGGAELNVATALARWGFPVKYFTALPDNIIAKDIKQYLKQKEIDTSPVISSGERIGLYYLQQGADMKSSDHVFDRKYSSFSTLGTGVVDWDNILQDVSWFHFSAIAPAVSESAAALCAEALEAARKKGIMISIDLNNRSALWKYGKEPIEIMPGLVQYCNVVMGNVWAANTLLGIHVDKDIHERGDRANYLFQARESAKGIFNRFTECQWVANTFRFDGKAGMIEYYAALDTKDDQSVSPLFTTENVVEKVGSGDCFMAGLIYGISNRFPSRGIIGYAAAAAFGKLQELGDTTNNTVEQVNSILRKYKG